MTKIKIALVGVGNNSASLIQGIQFYKKRIEILYSKLPWSMICHMIVDKFAITYNIKISILHLKLLFIIISI